MRSGAGYKRHQTSAYCDDCDDGIRGHDSLPSSVAGASRPSAGVRSSPHSHPKTLPSCPHPERGPSSTVLSPHSSHTRMTCLDVSVTSNPSFILSATTDPAGLEGGDLPNPSGPPDPVAQARAYLLEALPDKVEWPQPAGQLELCLEPKLAYICTSI